MDISKADLELLANLIVGAIRTNFAYEKLSGNLEKTIEIIKVPGGVQVVIPALRYDVNFYKETKVIKPTGRGSYANEVNETGGFSGKHKDYLDIAIKQAVDLWTKTVLGIKNYGIEWY